MYPEGLPYPSPNYRRGRRQAITHVVLHTCESSTLEGCLATLTDPYRVTSTGRPARVSAHYLVDSSGVYHLVNEEDEAWASGGTPENPLTANQWGVQIEVVGFANDPNTWDAAKLEHLAALLEDITRRNAIPLNYRADSSEPARSRGLVAHGALDPDHRSDPGIYFPWPQLKTRIQELRGQSRLASAGPALGILFAALAFAWILR